MDWKQLNWPVKQKRNKQVDYLDENTVAVTPNFITHELPQMPKKLIFHPIIVHAWSLRKLVNIVNVVLLNVRFLFSTVSSGKVSCYTTNFYQLLKGNLKSTMKNMPGCSKNENLMGKKSYSKAGMWCSEGSRGWGNLTVCRCPGVGNVTLASPKNVEFPWVSLPWGWTLIGA